MCANCLKRMYLSLNKRYDASSAIAAKSSDWIIFFWPIQRMIEERV